MPEGPYKGGSVRLAFPQATMREPQTAGVGSTPEAAMRGSTLSARSTSPEYEAALMYVL